MDETLISELFVLSVIFLGGIISNVFVIRGIWLIRTKSSSTLHDSTRKFTHQLIVNLAIADLVMLLVSIPTDVVAEHVSWPYGEFVCKYISPIQDICLNVSALSFAAIAVERYLVSQGTPHRSKRTGQLVILGIWFVSWITMGLPLAMYKKIITDDDRLECDVIWPNESVSRCFIIYLLVLVSAIGITGSVAYCRIRRNLTKVRTLYVRKRPDDCQDRDSEDSFIENTMKVSTMIIVLILVFVICVIPFPIFTALVEFGALDDYKFNYVIYLGVSCLLYSNSLANPVIVLLMSRECRSALFTRRVPIQTPARSTDPIVLSQV